MLFKYDCVRFTGYKPCSPGRTCEGCREYEPMGTRILIINLDALGDVLRTTAMLKPIKRKFKHSFIVWLADKAALPLLENNPLIDRVYPYTFEAVSPLKCERFDVLFNVDKSRRSCSVANTVNAKEKFGFGLTPEGAICPLNKEAEYLYNLGLDDKEKFKRNKKTEQELLAEAFALEYKRDEYILNLTDEETRFVKDYRKSLGLKKNDEIIGFNTGCSNIYPYKKMSFGKQVELIDSLLDSVSGVKIALLGGRQDSQNNMRLVARFKDRIISTPTDMGLRKGVLFIEACDMVVTGDTLGLHIAIALKKPVVSWFSISCEDEIDLYGRGVKITSDVECRPCWKSSCTVVPKCNEVVDIKKICNSIKALKKEKYAGV